MDAETWEKVGNMHMALGDFISHGGGNPGPTYEAARDAFSHALSACPEECRNGRQRLGDLQQKAFMATKRG